MELSVLYGHCISHYTFTDKCEWVKINYNGDKNDPNYLHVQVDYDEGFQLLFYPRQDNDPYLHEDKGTYFFSIEGMTPPSSICLAYNDKDFKKVLEQFRDIRPNEVTIRE